MKNSLAIAICLVFVAKTQFVISYDYGDEHPDDEPIRHEFMKQFKKSEENVKMTPDQITSKLSQLKQAYTKVEDWPTPLKKLGAVAAVTFDLNMNVVVFHRADRVWDGKTFDMSTNVFTQRNLGAIKENTIVTFDRDSGNVISEWGSGLFYLPHGLHIRGINYYVTDVAMHQVFRFNVRNSTKVPNLVLGSQFQPGKGAKFCKPTSVASLENGDFFVADGYCNGRIVKFNFNGEKILEWGKDSFMGSTVLHIEPPNAFAVPHALTLVHTDDKKWICVADRENGRVQCFNCDDGKFVKQYHSQVVGDRLFSVDYANGSLYVVNGPAASTKYIGGFAFDIENGDLSLKFGPLEDPHDITVSPDSREIYVADLSPDGFGHTLHKFLMNGKKPIRTSDDFSNSPQSMKAHRGDTALLVGSLVFFLTLLSIGAGVLISRKRRRGHKLFLKPWDKTTKNIFYDYNQFEKIPQNDDDFDTEIHNEVA